MNQVEKLDWDSDFFQIQIGKLKLDEEKNIDLHQYFEGTNLDLIYIFLDTLDPTKLIELEQMGAKLVDEKITYVKHLTDFSSNDIKSSFISQYNGKVNEQLLSLSINAGIYSRYFLDSNFERLKAEKMYKIWVEKSASGELSDGVFHYSENSVDSLGFVTIKTMSDKVNIGLFSVDANQRRKGIGKQLMLFTENYALKRNVRTIDVVTQKKNITACQFYESCGFIVQKVEYIFHLWKNKN